MRLDCYDSLIRTDRFITQGENRRNEIMFTRRRIKNTLRFDRVVLLNDLCQALGLCDPRLTRLYRQPLERSA